MNKIESACSDKNELNEIKSLYSKEYEKMKEDFDIILAEKDK